jgi:hypothetical protein
MKKIKLSLARVVLRDLSATGLHAVRGGLPQLSREAGEAGVQCGPQGSVANCPSPDPDQTVSKGQRICQ